MRPRLIAVDDGWRARRRSAAGYASMRPRLIAVDDANAGEITAYTSALQ